MKKSIIIFIVVFIVGFVSKGVYEQINKEKVPGKAKRIPCQVKVTSFERGYGNKDIKEAQILLKSGSYYIISGIDKAVHMESTLFDHIDMEKMDNTLNNILTGYVIEKIKSDKKLKIEYKIYENDRKDPKKKSDNCKLFRGYVVMKFINQKNKTVYQSQIDFMDPLGGDITDTLKCSVKSFLTYL